MADKTKPPLRAVRAARARITILQVGAQYHVLVDGAWQDTYHTADGALRRADVLAAKIALSGPAAPGATRRGK